jgi:hypothetical protein
MSEASTTAMLLGTRDMFSEQADAVTATVPREEVAEALTSEPPAELVLEVWRAADAGGIEKHKVNVAWKREDLESLLANLDGDAIAFSFDRNELERAIDNPEVEGHGLREAAVVLSIAAAAAAGASSASAAVHAQAELSPRAAAVQPAATHDEMTLAARGIESGPVAASHDEMTLAARGIESGPVAASHDETTLAARGIESGPVAASHDETTLAARGITPESPVVADSGSGFDLPSVEPGLVAGIAGGLAGAGLLIAAAAFATRRREPGAA